MTKQEIIEILKRKNIISKNNKKKFCWKKYWDNEIEEIFNDYKINYRTEDEAWFCLLHNIEPYRCEICGELAKFTGTKKTKYLGYTITCENCSPNQVKSKLKKFSETINKRTDEDRKKIIEKRKKTNLKKYGDENYTLFGSKDFKENLKNKYGNEHYNNREKYKETCLERYGVTCNLSLNSSERSQRIWNENKQKIREKQIQTSLKKYGYESPNQDPNIIKKQKDSLKKHYGSLEEAYRQKSELNKKTKLLRYGDENYHNKEQMSKTLLQRHLKFENENNCLRYTKVLELYGQGWKSLNIPIIYNGRFRYISNEYINKIQKYSEESHNLQAESKQEIELFNFIKEQLKGYKICRNIKNIIKDENQKYELDIYIPKLNLAFEYNGNYWHSNLYKDKYYHQLKTKLCYQNNIQLVHIYENDWVNNKDKIKNQIIELLNDKDCSKYNWISLKDYNKYVLSEPIEIYEDNRYKIYNEGKFIKKNSLNI